MVGVLEAGLCLLGSKDANCGPAEAGKPLVAVLVRYKKDHS